MGIRALVFAKRKCRHQLNGSLLDRRRLIEWMLEPLYALKGDTKVQTFATDTKILDKYLEIFGVERSQLKSIAWKTFLVAVFIAIVPGIESFAHGFFDGLAEHR